MEGPDPPPPPPQAARRKTPIATVTVGIHLIWIMHFTSLSGPAPTGAGPLQTSHGLSEKPPLIRQVGASHLTRAMSLSLLKFVGQASLVDDAMLPS